MRIADIKRGAIRGTAFERIILTGLCFHSCTRIHFLLDPRKMATIPGSTPTSSIPRAALVHKPSVGVLSSPVLGLPTMTKKEGQVRCSTEGKPPAEERGSNVGMSTSLMAAVCAATASSPAMALVDERMSTEGTGLPFGLSNNLLGWILLGVFGLIWSLYVVYTSTLEEDEESGLSL